MRVPDPRRLALVTVALAATCAPAADVPVHDLVLEERWRIGEGDDGILFGNLDRVVETASGDVYCLDTQLCEILVLDADGALVRRLGRRGEAPGEFERPTDLFVGLGGTIGVLQSFPGRAVGFEADGTPHDRLRDLGRSDGGMPSFRRAEANATHVVVSAARTRGEDAREHFLGVFDARGELTRELHTEPGFFRYGDMEYEEATFGRFHRRWSLGRSGRVTAALSFDRLRVHVWNADGSAAFVVDHPDYAAPVRTSDEVDELQRFYDGIVSFNPRSTFAVDARHPAVVAVDVRDDDSLWIVDAHGAYRTPRGVAMDIRVYSAEGSFSHRLRVFGDVDLARDEIHFGHDGLYVVTHAQDTAVSATGGGSAGEAYAEPVVSELVAYRFVGRGRASD